MTGLDRLVRDCRQWNDQYLLEQYALGPDAFQAPGCFAALEEEVRRRGLAAPSLPPTAPAPRPAAAPRPPYFRRLLAGDVALAEAYWIWGVGMGLLFTVLAGAAEHHPFVLAVLELLALIVGIVAWVAVWQSAGKYAGPRIWAVLARLSVVLGILRTLYVLVGATAH